MKRLLALLFLAALLTGCVAVPYDTYGTYQSGPVVTGHYSSGYPHYSSGYPNNYYSPAPVFVRPAPIYVPPAVQFNYSRSYSPRAHAPGLRHDGHRGDWRRGHDGHHGNHGPREHSRSR